MEDLQDKARLLPLQRQEKSVTSRLFEAYLACPTKCYLKSIGEVAASNDLAIWNETRSETYLCEGVRSMEGLGVISEVRRRCLRAGQVLGMVANCLSVIRNSPWPL